MKATSELPSDNAPRRAAEVPDSHFATAETCCASHTAAIKHERQKQVSSVVSTKLCVLCLKLLSVAFVSGLIILCVCIGVGILLVACVLLVVYCRRYARNVHDVAPVEIDNPELCRSGDPSSNSPC